MLVAQQFRHDVSNHVLEDDSLGDVSDIDVDDMWDKSDVLESPELPDFLFDSSPLFSDTDDHDSIDILPICFDEDDVTGSSLVPDSLSVPILPSVSDPVPIPSVLLSDSDAVLPSESLPSSEISEGPISAVEPAPPSGPSLSPNELILTDIGVIEVPEGCSIPDDCDSGVSTDTSPIPVAPLSVPDCGDSSLLCDSGNDSDTLDESCAHDRGEFLHLKSNSFPDTAFKIDSVMSMVAFKGGSLCILGGASKKMIPV